MGLDNGFEVKGVTRRQLPRGIKYPWDSQYDKDGVEVAYFRKYWGFRNTYLTALNRRFADEVYEYDLSPADLQLAIDILKNYIVNDPHDADGGYWDASTKKHLKAMRNNLKKIYRWWKAHPTVKIIFYDSY